MCRKLILLLTIVCISFIAKSQNSISGKITTSDGQSAALVNIEIKGHKKNTITNQEGDYTLNAIPDGKYNIIVSFVGLQTQEKIIELINNSTQTLNFILSENARELEEVIVSSKKGLNAQPVSVGKVAIDPMDLPQSISIIGQSVIRDQQSQRLSDVIKNVNGVYLATTRGGVQESFSARGYAFSSTNMFKNGARVNSGMMPEVSSLEKVEVLKGSAAILYGNVAPGGIINMVTKQPKFNYGGELSIRSGSYGLIKPAFDVYGPLSDKIAFRINGTYEKANSFRDVVKSDRFYINPSLLFKLGTRTELLLQGDYLNADFTPDFGFGSINDNRINTVHRSTFYGTNWQYNKANQTMATAALKHKLNERWSLNFTSSYQQYKRDYYSIERLRALANGDLPRPLNKIQSQEDYVIGQADITGKFNTGKLGHTLLAGIDADSYYTTIYGFNNPTVYDTLNIFNPGKYTARTDIPAAAKINFPLL